VNSCILSRELHADLASAIQEPKEKFGIPVEVQSVVGVLKEMFVNARRAG
jgi:hypothetical protein